MFAHAFFKNTHGWHVFVNLMLIDFCESYADKIIVNLILIKRTIHGEAVVYMCVTSRELCFLLD